MKYKVIIMQEAEIWSDVSLEDAVKWVHERKHYPHLDVVCSSGHAIKTGKVMDIKEINRRFERRGGFEEIRGGN